MGDNAMLTRELNWTCDGLNEAEGKVLYEAITRLNVSVQGGKGEDVISLS